jgi:two-component system, cell cycle response regulator
MTGRILIVDDTPLNIKVLATKLGREYFEVLQAENGPAALEIAATEKPDMILLDVMMPGMDGYEVCRRLKADEATRHVPVVMVTALTDVSDRIRGLEAGADDFLSKPVNDVALFARVRSLLRLKMMMDEWRMRESTSSQLGLTAQNFGIDLQNLVGARILLLDQKTVERDRIAAALQADMASLEIADDLASAVHLAQTQPFDLVIGSLLLEQEDGLKLCGALRSHEKARHVPILLVADDSDIGRVAKGLDLGANDYILVPIDVNELKARVRTQVRQKRTYDRLRGNYEANMTLAVTDPLTGAFNRRYLDAHLPRLLERAYGDGRPLSLLMLDIDHFKQVNDRFGHPVGDVVLKEVAARIQRYVRSVDFVARIGGEEFIVVMPETGAETAAQIAERLRLVIAGQPIAAAVDGGSLPVTISLGLATTGATPDPAESLIKRADDALYRAKQGGRNRVEWG